MSVCERNNAALLQYHYDAVGRLVALQSPMRDHQRFYSGATLCNEQRGDELHSHVATGRQLLGHRTQVTGVATVQLLGTEQQGCVVQASGDAGSQALAYTPHGEGADPSLPGFNGEQPDPLTGNYLLGNGYRAYNPTLLRFHSPDGFSPFSGGGLNAYGYCLGDPVNRADPTGHISWQAGLGIGLGVVGMMYGGYALAFGGVALSTSVSAASAAVMVSGAAGLGAAGTGIAQAVIAEGAPASSAASTLGWIALGLGAASLVAGVAANQWSSANKLKTLQVSRTIGNNGAADVEARGMRSLTTASPAMRNILDRLPADSLIALADTSHFWRDAVRVHRRPLPSVLGNATTAMDLVGNRRLIDAAFRIAIGGEPGMMPEQLSRAGINPRHIPDMDDDPSFSPNLLVQLDSAPQRRYALEAARVRQSTLRIQYRYS